MSYILDALKKSERERSGVRAGDARGDDNIANARSPWPLVVALVLTSNALLGLGWWAWQRSAGERNHGTHSQTTGAAANPADPQRVSIAPEAAIAARVESAPIAPASKAPVGDLAAEARRAPAPAAHVRATAKPARTSQTSIPPTPISPAATGVQPVLAHPAPTSAPWLRELPASFRTAVAPLNVNIHVYAGTSADSVLYINDRQYRAGETLPNGVRLDAVVADGALLTYQGQQFKLPRPN